MTFRDMTFCPIGGCVRAKECFRALTPEVEAAAEKWGGPNPPISVFADDPKTFICYSDGTKTNPNKPGTL
jgi:hypothetical protein